MHDALPLSVLVVEDNPDLAVNIADYLEAKGHLVDVAMDGVTGLHLAVSQPHDVVVLDLSLPVMAMKVLELLMKRSPQVVWRRDIEQVLWGDQPPDSDALRVPMHTLRAAIDPPDLPPLLHTVRGVGYQLKAPDATPP